MSRTSLALVAVLAVGCGSAPHYSGVRYAAGPGAGAGAGARAGGAQDIALARSKVAAGVVPSPDDLPFEGLYGEHDLPVDGAPCNETFCVAAGTGLAGSASWVQLGMSSNVDLTQFQRAPLNAALVIDNSCSMGDGSMEAVKEAAEKLVDQLNDGDILTVVRFDDRSEVLLGPSPVSNKDDFKAKIRTLQPGGGTCIECGLETGFAAVAMKLSPLRSNRVFLMTDAQPNVGATGETEFTRLLEANAARDIGLSLFGVGLDFGQTLVTRVTAAKGANYFFLATTEQMRSIFSKDFDLLVTPLAYDLHLVLQPPEGVSLEAVYGVPGADASKVESKVATVFLSRTRGALVGKLTGVKPSARVATASLTFKTVEGALKSQRLDVTAPAEEAPSWSGPGARKAVTLTRYLIAARKACELYAAGDKKGAAAEIAAAVKLLEDEATATGDAAVEKEAVFARALAALISK